ncbi:MAG: hypothetical protein AAF899_09740 [Pseudomonadota bacterium]
MTSVDDADAPRFGARLIEDTMSPWPAIALIEALGLDRPSPRAGDPLPPFWHWLYFLEPVPSGAVGRDGHAAPGHWLPRTGLPRRMWAGGGLSFQAPLPLGAPARRHISVGPATRKTGRSGPLAFVAVEHWIEGAAGLAVTERQDLVFREDPPPGSCLPAPGSAPPAGEKAPDRATCSQRWCLGTAALFRYSALTYNGHRIHYDAAYARGVEGYPGVVVHGPLLATLLFETARVAWPSRFEAGFTGRFDFRAVAPVFADEPFETCASVRGDHLSLWVRGSDGRLAMRATLR